MEQLIPTSTLPLHTREEVIKSKIFKLMKGKLPNHLIVSTSTLKSPLKGFTTSIDPKLSFAHGMFDFKEVRESLHELFRYCEGKEGLFIHAWTTDLGEGVIAELVQGFSREGSANISAEHNDGYLFDIALGKHRAPKTNYDG